MLANSPNPLNSSVSLNHKQGTNPKAKGNFQALGQAKRQGAKLPSVQSLPIGWRKEAKQGRKKKQGNMECVKYPFTFLKESNTA
jgi:hypothetical protein